MLLNLKKKKDGKGTQYEDTGLLKTEQGKYASEKLRTLALSLVSHGS